MGRVVSRIVALTRDDRGQDIIEYALLAALISVAAVGAVSGFAVEVNAVWDDVIATLDGALN